MFKNLVAAELGHEAPCMTPAVIVTVSGPRRAHAGERRAKESSRKFILMDVQSWQMLETLLQKGGNSQMKYIM
jgi:hypothetical protein